MLSLRCKCGALRGAAHGLSPKTGLRSVCYCNDCQAYAHFLGRASDILDADGGTDIFPVQPAQLEITLGHENLTCVRLSEKGMYRWYTDCCNTPIANSMAWPKMPFAGVVHSIMDYAASGTKRDEALGPIRARSQGKYGTPPMSFLFRVVGFLLRGFWKKQHQPSPFFHADGRPRARPRILSPVEREALKHRPTTV
ncbi:hypothetical protein K2X33_11755 [bacterium]|nr:hypothetical protein [bacterium]